jgi:catechol 2,3-dioxygenase-like lactoylglutathione lyase family enzyme
VAVLDHVSIQCADPAAARSFYETVLATIGGKAIMSFGPVTGFGQEFPDFWIGPIGDAGAAHRDVHLCFTASTREQVDAFVEAARERGAEVLHEPRVWPEYHATYYGGFVRDPDGNNVEAVCHGFDRG